MIPRDWKTLEAKITKDRERSCWISPNGEWYNCPFADHPIFAHYVLEDLYKRKPDPYYSNDSFTLIKEYGWILVHHDWAVGTIIQNGKKMTRYQYDVLKEFFGDERLCRGWTIDALWKEVKETL